MGSSLDLCGLVLLVSFDSLLPLIGFHFFSYVGGSGVLSHRAYSGDFLFFVGSLLQRRKIHSDFIGLTLPRGGKGPYFSFLTLRPGLLFCSDLSFFCNHGIQQHTHTHQFSCHGTKARPPLELVRPSTRSTLHAGHSRSVVQNARNWASPSMTSSPSFTVGYRGGVLHGLMHPANP